MDYFCNIYSLDRIFITYIVYKGFFMSGIYSIIFLVFKLRMQRRRTTTGEMTWNSFGADIITLIIFLVFSAKYVNLFVCLCVFGQ